MWHRMGLFRPLVGVRRDSKSRIKIKKVIRSYSRLSVFTSMTFFISRLKTGGLKPYLISTRYVGFLLYKFRLPVGRIFPVSKVSRDRREESTEEN